MIQCKEDYAFYLQADRIALGMKRKRPRLIGDDVWKFQRLLRKTEYFHNCKKNIISRIYFKYLYYRWYKMCVKLGFLIPLNVFGPGLSITFWSGPILVNPRVRVGENCRISPGVIIGRAPKLHKKLGFPKLGNHVFIGPNSVIVGPIEIANNVAIGANSYVNKSFTESGITIAGAPAEKILDFDSQSEIPNASDIARTMMKNRAKNSKHS
jgi:serine O-acetyltransferase